MEPAALPVRARAAELAALVAAHPVVILVGETGSGKTTQVAQIMLDAGLAGVAGAVAVTQPRRVAAVAVARRVAAERGTALGAEVGYAIRFEDRCSRETRIKFLTDGVLLRELLEDPELARYDAVVLDEAHERSLATDVLFALLKATALGGRPRRRARRRRRGRGGEDEGGAAPAAAPAAPAGGEAETAAAEEDTSDRALFAPPLRLVVTSATLDEAKFAAYFGGAPVLHVEGRQFPVSIAHAADDGAMEGGAHVAAAVDVALELHCSAPPGDILVFLAGAAECERAAATLAAAVAALPTGAAGDLLPLPLYATLPPALQARVFAPTPPGARRAILATNVAETSVTLEGVAYVVDAGLAKLAGLDAGGGGATTLALAPISRAAAAQRAGRAGRTTAGRCLRLYSRRFLKERMPAVTPPEIQRAPLAATVLFLKCLDLGVDVLRFDYMDAPERAQLETALRQLYVIGALDGNGAVTRLGRALARLPLEPALGAALLAARAHGCLSAALTVAAMLSVEGPVLLGGRGPEQLLAGGGGAAPPPGRCRPGAADERALSERGRALHEALQADGPGDHIFLLRLYEAWEAAGRAPAWCREAGVDARAMRFAADVRRQLARLMAEAGGSGGEGCCDDGGRDAKRPRLQDGGGGGGNGSSGDERALRALRSALAAGFAPCLARRLPRHNGYRTLGTGAPVLAQPAPACARLRADADDLLPEWVIYQELVAAGPGRTLMRGVCPIAAADAEAALPRLRDADAARLSGGASAAEAAATAAAAAAVASAGAAAAPALAADAPARSAGGADVEAARARFLARKKAASARGK
jgi:ATP-dependent RNA helicase DHX8/PRP22